MSKSFIKLIRSDETEDLLINHANAFRLLCLISLRARRTKTSNDKLEISEALIGDWKSMHMTEKEYRVAKQYLVRNKFIEISLTCRTKNNDIPLFQNETEVKPNGATRGATKRATRGTIAKLLCSRVCDINCDDKGDIKGDQEGDLRATSGRRTRMKEEKNIKKETTTKKEADASVAAVFPFLQGLGLSSEEIKTLIAHRTEEGLKHAVAYSKTVAAKESLVKLLMWAAKEMPNIPESIDIEENKKIAREFEETWHSKDCRIDVCSNAVEIISANGAICYIAIPYAIKGFRDNLQKNLLERKFKQNNENKAI